jgi:hypothetical protein
VPVVEADVPLLEADVPLLEDAALPELTAPEVALPALPEVTVPELEPSLPPLPIEAPTLPTPPLP